MMDSHRNRNYLNLKTVIVALTSCFVIFYLFWFFSTFFNFGERVISNAKCMPVVYGTQENLIRIYDEPSTLVKTVDASTKEIIDHYLILLDPTPNNPDWHFDLEGNWRIEEIQPNIRSEMSGKLFICDNLLENRVIETGCIFIRPWQEEQTLMEYSWRVSEISSGCNSGIQNYDS